MIKFRYVNLRETRELTQQDGWKTHSAVLSVPAVLLRKLPTILHVTFLSQGQGLEVSCLHTTTFISRDD